MRQDRLIETLSDIYGAVYRGEPCDPISQENILKLIETLILAFGGTENKRIPYTAPSFAFLPKEN